MADSVPFDITPPGAKIDMFPNATAVPGDDNAFDRSMKMHYAFGDKSPGQDSLYQSILSGREDDVRRQQAAEQALTDSKYRLDTLNSYLKDHNGPISEQALANFQQLTAPKEPNPKVDYEKVFSEKLLNDMYFQPGGLLQQAHEEDPVYTSGFAQVTQDNMAKQQVIRKALEDTQQSYKKQYDVASGTFGDLGYSLDKQGNTNAHSWWNDTFETMIPIKTWATIASNTGSGKFFLGANLQDTVTKAYMMPASDFQKWFSSTYDAIYKHNPLDAQHFGEALLSYSNSSAFWDNAGNVADLASLVPAGLAAKGLKSAFSTTAAVVSKMKRFDVTSILSSAGRVEEAAKTATIDSLKANFAKYESRLGEVTAADRSGDLNRFVSQMPSLFDPLSFIRGGSLREDVAAIPKETGFPVRITHEPGPEGELKASVTKDFILDLNEHPISFRTAKSTKPTEPGNFKLTRTGSAEHNFFIQKKSSNSDVYANGSYDTVGAINLNHDFLNHQLYVKWIGIFDHANFPGNKDLRNLLGQLHDQYPDATSIAGFRVSGARTGKAHTVKEVSQAEIDRMSPQELNAYYSEESGSAHVEMQLPKRNSGAPIFNDLSGTGSATLQGKRGILRGKAKVSLPDVIPRDPVKISREFTNRIGSRLLDEGLPALNGLADRNAVERLQPQAEQAAIQRAVQYAQQEYNHLGDGVADFGYYLPPETNPANIGQVAIYLHRPDALPFDRADQAALWARDEYKLPNGSYNIENQGNAWYIRVLRPIDETQPMVRQGLIETGNETPRNFINTLFGSFRSGEDVNPIDVRTARKTTVHGIEDQYRTIKEITAPIRALKGQSKRDFIRFTEANRDYVNQGIRGRFFNTMRDMETAWQGMFGHLPSEKEIVAYNSYIRAYEWDYTWRNLGIYRSLSRQGIRDFTLPKPDGTMTAAFKARQVQGVDWTSGHGVLIHDLHVGNQPIFSRARDLPAAMRNLVQEGIDNGEYKVIQVAQPQLRPLQADFEVNDLVEHLIVRDFSSDRIALNQLPFQPGGHVLYDYNHYIKQPRASWFGTRRLYTHDTTVRPMSFRGDADALTAHYNEAQRLLRTQDPGFDQYVTQHIPEGAARLRSEFESGRLSLAEPFIVTRRGQSAFDMAAVKNHYGPQVENYQQSPNNLYQTVNGEYAGERNLDLLSGNNVGTEDNPVFRLERPKLIDPLTTLNRAMATLSRNSYLEDFRYMAAEHFAQEFQGVISSRLDQLRSNPVAVLMDQKLKWDPNAPRDQIMAGKHFQQSFINFMHIQTDWGKNVGWLKERIYDTVAHTIGEGPTDAIANSKLLKAVQDPIHFVRSVAFVEHLGLFNPMQYFKQLQTLSQVASIAGPRIATKATPGAYLMRALMMSNESPAMIDHFARMAGRIPGGMSEVEFREAYQALRRTGLDIVEGEHAWKDDMADPSLFSGKAGSFLNKSTFFFKEGERLTRFSAFNAAYLQWREANPIANLDRRALQYILTQQDLMNGNMTRASNAAWQSMGKGILAVPLQFATYPIRIMEQFMSPRLVAAQRARMIATYSLLYGIPVGLGVTPAGLYPFYQDLQESMLSHGIKEDPNLVVETLHKGVLEVMAHMIGGKEYNAGESLGVGGLQITRDILQGKPFLDIMLGASGSTVGGIFDTAWPIFHDIGGVFYDGVDGKGPLIAADFGDALRNISTVNSAYRLYYAMAYSKYVSRGETFVDSVTPFDAVLSSIFGINPQSFDNVSREIESEQGMKSAQDYAEKEMVKYLRRAFQVDINDTKTREAYFRQAEVWRVLGDFRYDQYPQILKRATDGMESLVSQINNSYFWKNAPASLQEQRMKALTK